MAEDRSIEAWLRQAYDLLLEQFGPQHWWPGESRTETIVGAILTQNTAWTNVERAIARLKEAEALSLPRLEAMDEDELADLIRPSGTFRVKARRLKAFAEWSAHVCGHDLDKLFATPPERLRSTLLGVHGIGPETADAILLYAGDTPVFIVDAYTRRVLRRHFLIRGEPGYEHIQQLFESHLPADTSMYGEYHALLVALAKQYCRVNARCEGCPLMCLPHEGSA